MYSFDLDRLLLYEACYSIVDSLKSLVTEPSAILMHPVVPVRSGPYGLGAFRAFERFGDLQ